MTTKPDETAYTPAQQAAPQHLIDVHDHLRSELAQVRDVVEQVRRGLLSVGQARSVINTMTMRQNAWTLGAYCESYCRIVTGHHTLEDRSIFPHLRRRQPSLTHVIDRLEQEHHIIADVLEQVDEALVGIVGRTARQRGRRRSTSSSEPSTCSPTRSCRTSPTRSASSCTRSRSTASADRPAATSAT